MSSSEPVSKQLQAALPTPEEWRATLAALDDIADDLGLPKFGDFREEDISPDMIREAVREQVENAEARVAVTKTGEVGSIKRWENRDKTVLPLWFHIPAGKGVIKRLLSSGRFGIAEIAQMLGLRERALKDIIKGMGLSQLVVKADLEGKMRRYKEILAEYNTRGKMLVTIAAFKTAEKVFVDKENPTESEVLKVNVKELVGLSKIFLAHDPDKIEGSKGAGGQMPSIGIGVKITHVDKSHKLGQGQEVEAEILEDEP